MRTTEENSRTSVPVPDLPPELHTKILSLLPVKSLLRFRSTSQSFRSIIDTPYFINLHLQNSLNFNLILRHQSVLYLYDFPNLTSVVRLILPFIYATPRISLLGSCNGLLCIFHYSGEISFLNPSTRLLCDIPNFPIPSCHESCAIRSIYGFGFDNETGDYKLLRIIYIVNVKDLTFDSEVRLFIPRTNSWKLLLSFPYAPHFCIRYGECDRRYHNYPQTTGVLVDNNLHWPLAREFTEFEPELVVVAFNLTLENFNEIPLPEIQEVSKNGFGISVSVLGECLCMIVSCNILKLDVWVMKEYGSRDSWCKLFTLGEQCFVSPPLSLRLLSYSSDGSKVLLEYIGYNKRLLFWYDLKSEYISSVEGIPPFNEAIICVESLLPPSFLFPEEPVICCSSCLW